MNQDNNDLSEGPPIASLSDLEQDVSPHFLDGIRKKIYRRAATNQMVSFSWNLPKVVLMEMMMLIGHLLSASGKDKAKL